MLAVFACAVGHGSYHEFMPRALLLDLVALFNTEAVHAEEESERARLSDEARAIADGVLHTSATEEEGAS